MATTKSTTDPITPANAPTVPSGSAPASSTPKTDADRVKELEAENRELRKRLAAAGQTATPAKPTEPKFVFAEGQREELEQTGRTVSPFTGKRYVGSSPEDAREASADEFANAKPAAKK